MHHPTDTITHTMAFVTPVVEHWLEQEISMSRISITVIKRCATCLKQRILRVKSSNIVGYCKLMSLKGTLAIVWPWHMANVDIL